MNWKLYGVSNRGLTERTNSKFAWTDKNHEKDDTLFSYRDFNPGPPEYNLKC
jgi:hypothetical protein